jgi:GWxTD domain-containing protein
MKKASLFLASAFLVASTTLPVSAALKKYKDWSNSPEAYFLSTDERKAWESVDSDEGAEKFIQTYREARGKGFAAAIQSRIDFADRTLGLGKKKGSATLRGKTLILLGSPTKVSASSSGTADPTQVDISALSDRSTSSGANSSGNSNPNPFTNSGGSGDKLRGAHAPDMKTTQIWLYQAGTIPVGDKTKDTGFAFTIDQNDGKETVNDQGSLEKLFEQVVAYWAPKK